MFGNDVRMLGKTAVLKVSKNSMKNNFIKDPLCHSSCTPITGTASKIDGTAFVMGSLF